MPEVRYELPELGPEGAEERWWLARQGRWWFALRQGSLSSGASGPYLTKFGAWLATRRWKRERT